MRIDVGSADPVRARRWLPWAVLVLGLASLALLVLVERLSDRWSSRDLNRLHAIADLSADVTSVHLWVEKTRGAPPSPGDGEVPDWPEVEERLERARVLARGLVVGAEPGLTRRPLHPASDPEMAARLAELRARVERFTLTIRRIHGVLEDGRSLPAGLLADHDQAFRRLEAHAGALQGELGAGLRAQKRRSRILIGVLLASWVLLVVLSAAALWHLEGRRTRAEAQLKERESQLLQAQKMEAVGRLAGGIAHDINNYLAAIRGQCELMKMKAADEATDHRMDLVLSTADRASSLIERLLAFSRRRPGPARLEVLDLNTVIAGLEPMLERLVGDDIRLAVGGCEHRCPVRMDPSQLEQVVVNLLINARDALPEGGEVVVSCACRWLGARDSARPPLLEEGDYVELTVSDDGPGIPSEVADRIFEPFFSTKEDATGLGLSTVYGIVQQAGGTVEVESEPGAGATFRILLPRRTAGEDDLAAGGASTGEARAAVPRGRGEHLLVVDDHEEFRASVEALLDGLGYEVHVAENAESAIELAAARGGAYDLVVTDVVMPGADGPELVERLHHEHGPRPVLYVSGYTGGAALDPDAIDGRSELLQKPFPLAELARTVRELLDARPAPPTA